MYVFGAGTMYGFRTDIANSTPINLGLIQNATLDVSGDVKELFGSNSYPVAVARGKSKVTCKANVARVSGLAFNSFFFGQTVAPGQIATAVGEVGTIPSTPFTITVANAATFVDDYGVYFSATGLPLTKVASAPAAGQYSVNITTGVYTFAAADTAKGVLITYSYTIPSTGEKLIVANTLMGVVPVFQAVLYTSYNGQNLSLKLHQCVSNKFGFNTKLDDFTIPEFDFSCFADAAGNVMSWSFGEAS